MSEKRVHPFCSIYYKDAYRVYRLLETSRKWCPEIEEFWDEWAGPTDEEDTYEEFEKTLESITDEADTIQGELKWEQEQRMAKWEDENEE